MKTTPNVIMSMLSTLIKFDIWKNRTVPHMLIKNAIVNLDKLAIKDGQI